MSTETTVKHSPTPFTRDAHRIEAANGLYVAEVLGNGCIYEADFDFILRAVNSHDELLAACEDAVAWADKVPHPYRDWPFIRAARAAIAKARG